MNGLRFLLLLTIIFAVGGCVDSVSTENPLYTEKDVVFDASLVGNWQSSLLLEESKPDPSKLETTTITIKKSGANGYKIVGKNIDGKESEGDFRVMKLGEHYFFVFEPPASAKYKYYIFCKVTTAGSEVRLWPLNPEWLKGLLRRNPKAVPARFDEKTRDWILTASTEDLQAFVQSHANTAEAWGRLSGYLCACLKRVGNLPVAETGLTSKKQRTLDYWWQLRLHVDDLKKGDKPEQVAAKLDRVIAAVDELPTLGVDLDAVNCSLDISAAFSSMSKYIKGNRGDGRLVEAFVRGFLGDPFGVANEVAAERKT